jgi:hypothetical protein
MTKAQTRVLIESLLLRKAVRFGASGGQVEAYTKIGMDIVTASTETIDWETIDFSDKTVYQHMATLYNLTKAILEKTQGSALQPIAQSVFDYYEKEAAQLAAQALTETDEAMGLAV